MGVPPLISGAAVRDNDRRDPPRDVPGLRRPRRGARARSTPRSPAPPAASRRSRSSAASRASARRACSPSSNHARVRAGGARVLLGQCLELGGAQIPYAPLVAALRPLARGLAGAEAEATARGHPQRARRAAAGARRRPARAPTTSRAPARAGCSRRCSACSTSSAARAGPARDRGPALGRRRDPRLHHLPRPQRARGARLPDRHLPQRRAAPPPPAPPAARGARARVGRGADRARALQPRPRSPRSSRGSSAPRRRRAHRPPVHPPQGNPLYTEELLAASEEGDSWLLPETLRDVLIARVERLSPTAQAVVRIAAVPTGRPRTRCSRRSPTCRRTR